MNGGLILWKDLLLFKAELIPFTFVNFEDVPLTLNGPVVVTFGTPPCPQNNPIINLFMTPMW